MRTTITLDDELVKYAKKETKEKSLSKALQEILKRQKALQDLRALRGSQSDYMTQEDLQEIRKAV